MPIGSRSYYDSVGATDNKAQPQKRGFFQKNDVQPPVVQTPASNSKVASTPASAAVRQAKKRRAPGAPKPTYHVPPPAAPIDSVVSQIVDLAGRVAGVLSQAEEMVKRAEQVMANAEAAAVRSEAAAVRAEVAASRLQLSALTAPGATLPDSPAMITPIATDTIPAPAADPMAALQEKLRSGLLQLDQVASTPAKELDAPVLNAEVESVGELNSARDFASMTPMGIVTDGPNSFTQETGMKGGMSGFTRERRAETPSQEGGRDSVAHGLVSLSYGSDIPRVSPFILSTATGSNSSTEGEEMDDDSSRSDDSQSLGVAV